MSTESLFVQLCVWFWNHRWEHGSLLEPEKTLFLPQQSSFAICAFPFLNFWLAWAYSSHVHIVPAAVINLCCYVLQILFLCRWLLVLSLSDLLFCDITEALIMGIKKRTWSTILLCLTNTVLALDFFFLQRVIVFNVYPLFVYPSSPHQVNLNFIALKINYRHHHITS